MQPDQDDFYDVDVFNENFEKIDAALQRLQELAQPQKKEFVAAFFESGIFRPADYGLQDATVDIFYMVGGGGGGGGLSRGGGGGGYCRLLRDILLAEESYAIVIGSGGMGGTSAGGVATAGGRTIAFGETAEGGLGATSSTGGRGGSGGGGSPGGGGGFAGSGGQAGGASNNTAGAAGGGNITFCPVNPYDGIFYGCGGGGGNATGGGSGGPILGSDGVISRNGALGGGGGGGTVTLATAAGGCGGLGGGGGGGSSHQTSGVGGPGGNGLVYIYAVRRATPATEQPLIESAGGAGSMMAAVSAVVDEQMLQLGQEMRLDLKDLITKQYGIQVGILRDSACIDVAIFSDLSVAEAFLQRGVWYDADGVVRLADGFGTGDTFDNGVWGKQALEAFNESLEAYDTR